MGVLADSRGLRMALLGLGLLALVMGGGWLIWDGAEEDESASFGSAAALPEAPTSVPRERNQPAREERLEQPVRAEAPQPPTPVDSEPPAERSDVVRPTSLPPAPGLVGREPTAENAEVVEPSPPGDIAADAVEITGRNLGNATGGMVAIPEATVWIGSDADWVERMTRQVREPLPLQFTLEAPRHQITQPEFLMDRYEVSNEQYRLFLMSEGPRLIRVERRRSFGEAFDELLADMRGRPENLDVDVLKQQFYRANQDRIVGATNLAPRAGPDGIDWDRTFAELDRKALPTGTQLVFYHRAPPAHWPDLRYASGEADWPVHGLSFYEAIAFAQWAGKYLPREREWEVAATNAPTRAWPWGAKPLGFDERVNFNQPNDQGRALMSVQGLPKGASAFGCHHVLGNVAEWTGSVLRGYPDGAPFLLNDQRLVTVRGGAAVDDNRLLLTPRSRGWLDLKTADGVEPRAPLPARRIPWVGLRCAARGSARETRALTMQSLVESLGLLPLDEVAVDAAGGIATRRWIPQGQGVENAAFVRERNSALVAVALEHVWSMDLTRTDRRFIGDSKPITSRRDLEAVTKPFMVGLLHLDAPWLGWRGEVSRGRLRRAKRFEIAAGSYAVVVDNGLLRALPLDPLRLRNEAPTFLQREGVRATRGFDVKKSVIRGRSPRPQAELRYVEKEGSVSYRFAVPLPTVDGVRHTLTLEGRVALEGLAASALDLKRGAQDDDAR